MEFAEYLSQVALARLKGAKEQFGKRSVPLPPGGRNAEAEQTLETLFEESRKSRKSYYELKPRDLPAGAALLDADPATQAAVAMETVHRLWQSGHSASNRFWLHQGVLNALLAKTLPLTSEQLEYLLTAVAEPDGSLYTAYGGAIRQARAWVDRGNALTEPMVAALGALRERIGQGAGSADWRKMATALAELLGVTDYDLPDPGETWADAVRAQVAAATPEAQAAWRALFPHLLTADGPAKPSAKWRKECDRLVAAVEAAGADVAAAVAGCLSVVTMPRIETVAVRPDVNTEWEESRVCTTEKNITLLKGMAWLCAGRSEPALARALAHMAVAALRKGPGGQLWAHRAGSAAVWALGEMDCAEAIAQLGRVRLRVSHKPTQAAIEKTLDAAAQRSGLTRDELEDLAVPTYGLDASGVHREEFGEYTGEARMLPDGTVSLTFFGPDGKPLKSVPAAVRSGHGEEFRALKGDAQAAESMLAAQKLRFDGFLLADRTWKLAEWRERYLPHPLLGGIARRLIWHVQGEDGQRGEGLWDAGAGAFVALDGAALSWAGDGAELRLWHPLGFPAEYVLRWREALEAKGIQQPFKQAHREVYILTDAEITTGTYSNRFAGHLLKQHQMQSLAQQRGWRHRLIGGWDGSAEDGAVRLELPKWNLRAEFWVEGADVGDGDSYVDTGMFKYVATDQVRFCPLGQENPLPLAEVPALVFSEVMRQVDLFVAVAGVGNDPNWRDRGEERYRDYWTDYAFGDLSASAVTRGEVLARLLPRLKIAPRCRIQGKFLYVRGDLRTYKIHLGSGNILMEPNDEYLCIVEARGGKGTDGLFLPFEGDARLALILSKAFLLADDKKITDRTILSQIGR